MLVAVCCLLSLVWSLTPFSARTLNVYERPALRPAIDTLERNKHDTAVISTLDRLAMTKVNRTFCKFG